MSKTLSELSQKHQNFVVRAAPAEARDRHHMAVAFLTKNYTVKAGGKELVMLDDVELVASLTDVPSEQWRLAREPANWFQFHKIERLFGVPLVRQQGLVGGADISVLPPAFVNKFPRLGRLALAMQWALSSAACCRREEWEHGRKMLRTVLGGRDGVLMGSQCYDASLLEEKSVWEPSFYMLVDAQAVDAIWDAVSGTIGLSDRNLPPAAKGFVSHVLGGREHRAPMGGWIHFRKQADHTTEVVIKSGHSERVLYLPPGMKKHVQDRQIIQAGDLVASAADASEARKLRDRGHGAAWDLLRDKYNRADMAWMCCRWFEWQVLSDEDEAELLLVPGKYAAPAARDAIDVMLDLTGTTKLEDSCYLVPPFLAKNRGRFRFNLGELAFDIRPKSPHFLPLRSEL